MCARTDTEVGPERLKRLDGNVCSCPSYIVTINPPKDTVKYIVDDKATQSNIKLLTNSPIEDKQPSLRQGDGLLLESLHKKYAEFQQFYYVKKIVTSKRKSKKC